MNDFNNKSKSNTIAIASVLGIILMAIIAYLGYNNYTLKEQISQQTEKFSELEQVKMDLDKEYYAAMANLEEMKGESEELNLVIENQKDQLKAKKGKISKLLRSNKGLKAAKQELESLKVQYQQSLAEIAKLKSENQELYGQNQTLTNIKDELENTVKNVSEKVTNLNTANATLVSQKESLESQNNSLSQTVTRASVINVVDIIGTGWKKKSSGKFIKKRYANNVDQIKVCFSTTKNIVAENGDENFYVRVIDPLGVTMASESMESGVTKTNDSSDMRYTFVKTIDYNNDENLYCMNWNPGEAFKKGSYSIQIYNKGYLAGEGSFILK